MLWYMVMARGENIFGQERERYLTRVAVKGGGA